MGFSQRTRRFCRWNIARHRIILCLETGEANSPLPLFYQKGANYAILYFGSGYRRVQRAALKAEHPEQLAAAVAARRPFFDAEPRAWVNMGVQADNLAGEYFLTTGSGKFFRNVEPDPVHSIGIVEINAAGDSWRIV